MSDMIPLSEEATTARQVLQDILLHMTFEATIEAEESSEQIVLTMNSDRPMGLLIGKGGQTLNAIELLVRTITQTRLHALGKHIVVDAEGYRARQSERLQEMARQAASQVLATGEPVPMEPMSPRDRRTVHMTLVDIEGVESTSVGEEPYRHIVVSLPGQTERAAAPE
jgi:spoIIIJ-associated protein